MTENNAAQAAENLLDYAMAIAHERELDVTGHKHDSDGAVRRFKAAVDRALLSKLRAEGVQAGDEREAFVAWLTSSFPNVFNEFDAVRRWQYDHVSALSWKRRAALASAPVADRQRLRELVDVVWNEATESTAVPDTPWADRLIDKVYPSLAASAPVAGEAHTPIGFVDPVYVAGRQRGMKWNAKIYDAPTQEATAPLYAAPQASNAECSCPSGDGSLRHPCAVHPQASEAVRNPTLIDLLIRVQAWMATTRGVNRPNNLIRLIDAALSAQPGAQRTGGSDEN